MAFRGRQETNARMEKSLGDVLISSRRKSGKRGKGGKGGKGKCKDAFKGCKGSQRIKNTQGDKCSKVGKGSKDTAVVQRAAEIAIPSKPAEEFFLVGSENKKRKVQPPVEFSHEQVGRSFKSESPPLTAAEAAEMYACYPFSVLFLCLLLMLCLFSILWSIGRFDCLWPTSFAATLDFFRELQVTGLFRPHSRSPKTSEKEKISAKELVTTPPQRGAVRHTVLRVVLCVCISA